MDEDSLPHELVPIAWTTSESVVSLTETQEASRKPNFSQNPKHRPPFGDCFSTDLEKGREREKILMGIMHSKRPHYGVQVSEKIS